MARILVGYDGSEPSKRAVAYAMKRAVKDDEVILLSVIPSGLAARSLAGMMPAGVELPPPLSKTFEQNARERLEDAIRVFAQHHVRLRSEIRAGEAADTIVKAAKDLQVDEVIIGHKSYERDGVPLGPVAERLVRDLPATVTVVR